MVSGTKNVLEAANPVGLPDLMGMNLKSHLKKPTENGTGCAALWLTNSRYSSTSGVFLGLFFLIRAFHLWKQPVICTENKFSQLLHFLEAKAGLASEIAAVGWCWGVKSCPSKLAELRQNTINISLHVSSCHWAPRLRSKDGSRVCKQH